MIFIQFKNTQKTSIEIDNWTDVAYLDDFVLRLVPFVSFSVHFALYEPHFET